MNILIMGVAGAGKGTMAERIKEHYNIPHISSGEMFREAIRQETPLGKLAKQYIDHGLLVPDDVTITMVKERLAKPDCTNGYLLDGFPRTMIQTGAFEKAMDDLDKKLDIVINLNVDFEVLEGYENMTYYDEQKALSPVSPVGTDDFKSVDYNKMSYFNNTYIFGATGSEAKKIYQELFEIVNPAGITSTIEILTREQDD